MITALPTNTTGAEPFKSLDDYISGQLKWSFVLAYAQTESCCHDWTGLKCSDKGGCI